MNLETNRHKKLYDILNPLIQTEGFHLVQINLLENSKPPILQLLVEGPHYTSITIEQCAQLNQVISTILDVEDPIKNAYILEISSPGLERPLITLKDFDHFKNRVAKISLKMAINGQKKYRVTLKGVKDNHIVVCDEKETYLFSIEEIEKAKLLLTPELLTQLLNQKKHKGNDDE